ncbi:hypothetical protein [Hoeflea poritis]|uniref:N-acetyltransferase domain-containing protein n=1 Tax=Hoeflea poritis TaxID=2993659 RepID=A0ABT4VPG0_9HYPH|nr:hypothetical protein [Hoeflea poritis]MDA4846584.1 hypothetical protein [Hoeflea poritis]
MVEIRTYDGDGSDFAELCLRIRKQEGEEEKWSPLWDAAYLRRQIEAPAADRELMVGAYDGERLIGSFFAVPYMFDVRGETLAGTFSTCLMIDPAFRGLTPYVIEKLRRRHRDNGYAFSLGFVMGGPNSGPHQCWTGYAKAYPKNFQFITDAGYWIRAFDPSVLDEAGRAEQARANAELGARLQSGADAAPAGIGVRACRHDDLGDCLELLKAQNARADWSIRWDRDSLGQYLIGSGKTDALVAERNGSVAGVIGLHWLSVWNEREIRGVVIDMLAAGDDLIRRHLLQEACTRARQEGAQVATALRSSMFRARTVIPSGFLPAPDPGRLVVLFADESIEASASDSFELMLR